MKKIPSTLKPVEEIKSIQPVKPLYAIFYEDKIFVGCKEDNCLIDTVVIYQKQEECEAGLDENYSYSSYYGEYVGKLLTIPINSMLFIINSLSVLADVYHDTLLNWKKEV